VSISSTLNPHLASTMCLNPQYIQGGALSISTINPILDLRSYLEKNTTTPHGMDQSFPRPHLFLMLPETNMDSQSNDPPLGWVKKVYPKWENNHRRSKIYQMDLVIKPCSPYALTKLGYSFPQIWPNRCWSIPKQKFPRKYGGSPSHHVRFTTQLLNFLDYPLVNSHITMEIPHV